MEVRSDRRYRFDVDAPTLWAALVDVDAYRRWWPWLARFDADRFEPGATWTCVVQPPLPYSLRFVIRLDDVDPCASASATVSGDIEGSARLTLETLDVDRTEVRLESALAPANPLLRSVARVAGPVVRFGHDWVLDTGAAQFRRRGL